MIQYFNFEDSELDIPIYRIITVERFFDLLVTKKNILVSPSLWEDPFEAFTSKAKIKINGTLIASNDRIWGQCWTTRINETDAMWRIYTPSKNGVKIKTTPRKLINSFLSSNEVISINQQAEENNKFVNEEVLPAISLGVSCGKVKYLSIKKITDPVLLKKIFSKNSDDILFIKRLEFKHESEFRIVFWHFDPSLMDFHQPLFMLQFQFQ